MSGWKTWDEEKYHSNWPKRKRREAKRAKGKCDFCHAERGTFRPGQKGKPAKVMLAVAHLNHDPENARALLAVLCQRCHTLWDVEHHARNRRNNQRKRETKEAIDLGQNTTNLKIKGDQDKLKMKNRASIFADTTWRIRNFLLMLELEKAKSNRSPTAEQISMFAEIEETNELVPCIHFNFPITQFLHTVSSEAPL
jgi:hypothetical protein